MYALVAAVFAVSGLTAAPVASAADFSFSDDDLGWGDWGRVDFTWNTRLTAGVQVRTESRDYSLVDKQNVPANQDVASFPGFSRLFDICEVPAPDIEFAVGNVGDCFTQTGDPRPGMRLINAPGGYNINGDDGNLNYDRGDITYANFQFRSELTAHWNDFTAKISGLGYYDPVNNDFDTHLADEPIKEYSGRTFPQNRLPDGSSLPEPLPVGYTATLDRTGFTQRQDDEEDRLGEQLRLLEAYVAYDFDIAGRTLRLAVGDQRMRWGESTFMIFNNLARINPPSAELYDRPGTEVRDAFIPVGMVTASMNVTTNFNVEAFYQYDWEPVEPSVRGSFLSTSDVAGGGEGPTPIMLAMGNAPEAPMAPDLSELTVFQQLAGGLFRVGGIAGTQTSTTRTIHLEDEAHGYPDDGGQYGLRLDYYADWLNGGTEISIYGMNIHSRLPFFSAYAAERSCITSTAINAAKGISGFDQLADCRGFDDFAFKDFPNFDPTAPIQRPDDLLAEGNYRVDTMRGFLDYPEDIKVFGLSGTTQAGDWSLAGEIAYSPNQPAQIAVTDVVYSAVQPAFPPDGDLASGSGVPLADIIGDGTFQNPRGRVVDEQPEVPSSRIAVPDYISQYRCADNVDLASQFGLSGSNADVINSILDYNGTGGGLRSDLVRELSCSLAVEEGEYIRGYERLQVGQVSMTGIRVLGSSHPISASINSDQIIFVGEVAAYKAFDMPGLDELQFQGSGASQTHYSQGVADYDMQKHGYYLESQLDSNGEPLPGAEPLPFDQWQAECQEDKNCLRRVGPTDRLNYDRADPDIFADDFAMGYRMRVTADYNNGLFGWQWTPGFTFYHDVHGTSISPGQDFVEDRKRLTLHTNVLFTNNFSGNFQYRLYWGAGDRNLRLDRDYAELSLSYAF